MPGDTNGTLMDNKAQNTATAHKKERVINQKVMCYEFLSIVMIYAFPKTHNLKVVGSNPTPATNQINKLEGTLEKFKKILGPHWCRKMWGDCLKEFYELLRRLGSNPIPLPPGLTRHYAKEE